VPERSTIYEVARRSGVSTATVSRVMRDGVGFSQETRDRVLAAARELRWVPSGPARGLAVRRAGIVGLLFPDLDQAGEAENESPLFVDQVIRGAERAATAVGDAVLIAATRNAPGHDLALSVAGKVDGLVVMARSLSDRDLARIARSVPVVVLAAGSAPRRLDFVGADNRGGSRQVTSHLIEQHGYRDIAFIGGPAQSPDSIERFRGFSEALRAAGLSSPDVPDAEGGFTEAGGERAMRAVLAGRKRPRAVVLGRVAGVVPHAREPERALAVQVVLALAEVDPAREVAERRRADLAPDVHVHAAQGVDQLGEVLEVDLDHVVDAQPVAEEVLDGLDHERGAADRVGRVDLLRRVARDVGVGVAHQRQLSDAADAHVVQHDAVRLSGPACVGLGALLLPSVGPLPQHRSAG